MKHFSFVVALYYGLSFLFFPAIAQASDFKIAYGQGEYENLTDTWPLEADLALDVFEFDNDLSARLTLRYVNNKSDFERLDNTEWFGGVGLEYAGWDGGVQLNQHSLRLHSNLFVPIEGNWALIGGIEHQRRIRVTDKYPKLKISRNTFGVDYKLSPRLHTGLQFKTGNFGRESVSDVIQAYFQGVW